MYVNNGIAYADNAEAALCVGGARYVGNLQMVIEFTSGESRLLDLVELAQYPAFEPLLDEDTAKEFSVIMACSLGSKAL